jgi:3-mercaptopyruvate sulfurtransferase SseA
LITETGEIVMQSFLVFFFFSQAWAVDPLLFQRPVLITSQTKLIDATHRDEWVKSHVAGSIYFAWDQLSQPGARSRGTLRNKPQVVADDLSQAGIHINDHVVVIGPGVKGRGNEGRIAWMLHWLGFQKVTVVSRAEMMSKNQQFRSGPEITAPALAWQPKINNKNLISKKNLLKGLQDPRTKTDFVLIDVMPSDEKHELPDILMQAKPLIFSWKKLIDSSGAPDMSGRAEFEKLKIPKSKKIVLISYAGLSSAYATLVLNEWGYQSLLLAEGLSEFIKNDLTVAPNSIKHD